jgi:hypothetical protein
MTTEPQMTGHRTTYVRLALAFVLGLGAGLVAPAAVREQPPDGRASPGPTANAAPAHLESPAAAPRPEVAAVAQAAAGSDADTPSPPGTDRLARELRAQLRETERLRGELQALAGRVATLEQAAAGADRSAPVEPGADPPGDGGERRRQALVVAGLPPQRAAEILWREGQHEMQRLELRDQASREGWLGTERYFAELRALAAQSTPLRREIGDEAYDRYLFAAGEPNRVQVTSVIHGSPAEQVGVSPGDVLLRYGDERLFDAGDLRAATTSGERGELVRVQVLRGGGQVDLWVPRGPLGVRLDTLLARPDAWAAGQR